MVKRNQVKYLSNEMVRIEQQKLHLANADEALRGNERRSNCLLQLEEERAERERSLHKKQMELLNVQIEYYKKKMAKLD